MKTKRAKKKTQFTSENANETFELGVLHEVLTQRDVHGSGVLLFSPCTKMKEKNVTMTVNTKAVLTDWIEKKIYG